MLTALWMALALMGFAIAVITVMAFKIASK